jgi:hypothetical protein
MQPDHAVKLNPYVIIGVIILAMWFMSSLDGDPVYQMSPVDKHNMDVQIEAENNNREPKW